MDACACASSPPPWRDPLRSPSADPLNLATTPIHDQSFELGQHPLHVEENYTQDHTTGQDQAVIIICSHAVPMAVPNGVRHQRPMTKLFAPNKKFRTEVPTLLHRSDGSSDANNKFRTEVPTLLHRTTEVPTPQLRMTLLSGIGACI